MRRRTDSGKRRWSDGRRATSRRRRRRGTDSVRTRWTGHHEE